MATLQTRLENLATRIATECKALRTLINGNMADLSALTTTNKANLVAALNEVKGLITGGSAVIDDGATSGDDVTWSVDKILAELSTTQSAAVAAITNGASGAYDTLVEIQAILEGNAGDIGDIVTALANRVRTDTAAQGLNDTQKANARTNIGAVGTDEIGNPDTNFVTGFESGLA